MKPDNDSLPLLRWLHRRVFVDPEVRAVLDAGFVRLAVELGTRPEPPHATCTIPIKLFTSRSDSAGADQDQVRLCRLFLLRRGARMAVPERHTNSVQRLVSYRGQGWVHQGVPGGPAINLRARAVRSPQEGGEKQRMESADPGLAALAPVADIADLPCHWDIVPAGVWHYPEAGGGQDWATVTFHSAAEDEIVDETPTGGDSGPTLT